MPIVACIVGLPATGKTRLALALASELTRRHRPVLVAHTDVMKVTARTLTETAPKGPAWAGDVSAKAEWMCPLLDAQVNKAATDNYDLIIEGTLAVCFTRGQRIQLELDADTRQQRAAQKHESARSALAGADLSTYADFLQQHRTETTLVLDASAPVSELVARCLVVFGIDDRGDEVVAIPDAEW